MRVHRIAVRDLVEFVLRRGGLESESGFVGRKRAWLGTRGHQRIQRSRPAGYQSEVALTREVRRGDLALTLQGRLDGVLALESGVVVEEIKTFVRDCLPEPDSLHWAQLKVYGFLYASEQQLPGVQLQLTYLELKSGHTREWREDWTLERLAAFFQETVSFYLNWLEAQGQWWECRDPSIRSLSFPYPSYRLGQRELAVAVYRTLQRGGRLFAEAPTGVGKTMSVLFPAIKSLGEGLVDRVFYLTARTVGRRVAEKCLGDLRDQGLRLRSLTLTAREKICPREGGVCDLKECPLATQYYDRRHAAMREVLDREEISGQVLQEVAKQHQVCPFELGLDASMWVEAVIGDYNHLFDPVAFLRRHFAESGGAHAILIDEAHNLVERGREMFSAELRARDLREVRRALGTAAPRLGRALSGLAGSVGKLCGKEEASGEDAGAGEVDLFSIPHRGEVGQPPAERPAPEVLPEKFLAKTEKCLDLLEEWLAQNDGGEVRPALLDTYFGLLGFLRVAGDYDTSYAMIRAQPPDAAVKLFCLNPALQLREMLDRGRAAIFFSATLTPLEYYRGLLGGEPVDPTLRLGSPFPVENLKLIVHQGLATDFKSRVHTAQQVAEAIQALVQGRQGNYLVYFPSYQYLNEVHARVEALCPGLRLLCQRTAMPDTDREAFLAAFATDRQDTLVGFAVMGGIFGEAIDLLGDRLIGAVVVGVGLPQLCRERDLIRDHFQKEKGRGFDYAYTFPGMNRVLQAVGRVIRSEHDRGVVLLIDARFAQKRYRELFPSWWRPVMVTQTAQIRDIAGQFWSA